MGPETIRGPDRLPNWDISESVSCTLRRLLFILFASLTFFPFLPALAILWLCGFKKHWTRVDEGRGAYRKTLTTATLLEETKYRRDR